MMNLKKVTEHSLLHTLNPCSTLICQKERVKMKSQSQDLHILCSFDQRCVYGACGLLREAWRCLCQADVIP